MVMVKGRWGGCFSAFAAVRAPPKLRPLPDQLRTRRYGASKRQLSEPAPVTPAWGYV